MELVALFAKIAEAYENGARTYNEVIAYLSDNGYGVLRLKKPGDNHRFLRESMNGLSRFLRCKRLTRQNGRSTELSDDGEAVAKWAVGILECFDRNAERPLRLPKRTALTIATHHLYEWTALPIVLKGLVKDSRTGPVHVRIRQVASIYESINLLRDNAVDAVIDGVPKARTFDRIQKLELGLAFRRIVLVPNASVDEMPSDEWISLDDLADKPLAYVDMPEHVERYLGRAGPLASRVRLSTTASVVRMVQEQSFFGLAHNWTTLLGEDYSARCVVKFLNEQSFDEDYWRLFVREKSIRERRKPTDVPNKLELLHEYLLKFAADETHNLVAPQKSRPKNR